MGAPDTGDTAWMLASAALVLLMTPGLAFFYGGMVRARGVLNMIMMSISAMGVVTVLWVLYGYSLAFGNDVFGGLIGNFDNVGLSGTVGAVAGTAPTPEDPAGHQYPVLAFVMFQLMFAIITVALISGAIALAAVSLLPASRSGPPTSAEQPQHRAPQAEYARQAEGYER